jgi:hypothetical protein
MLHRSKPQSKPPKMLQHERQAVLADKNKPRGTAEEIALTLAKRNVALAGELNVANTKRKAAAKPMAKPVCDPGPMQNKAQRQKVLDARQKGESVKELAYAGELHAANMKVAKLQKANKAAKDRRVTEVVPPHVAEMYAKGVLFTKAGAVCKAGGHKEVKGKSWLEVTAEALTSAKQVTPPPSSPVHCPGLAD